MATARRAVRFGWREAGAVLGKDAGEPVILMYHRIGSPAYDPWGLCVSAENFRQQLTTLKTSRAVLSMDQLVDALDAGDVPPGAAAITFDDGYADNAGIAKPLLEEMGIPATFFLATGFVGSERPYWWDALAALVLRGRAAADIDFEVVGERLAARWGPQPEVPRDLASWRCTDATDDPRRSAYVRLWRGLQRLAPTDRDVAMAELRARLSVGDEPTGSACGMPMSPKAARTLASGVTTVDGHGQSHVPLPSLPPEARSQEIAGGRADLAVLTGVESPAGFAYPHGEWDAATRDTVRDAGYRWAVTTAAATIDSRHYDRFALPRVQARNWSGRGLLRALRHGRA
jgi:peptidoglycan/xylan/chitin deacetylase (PgdA/CDA1 family)